MTTNTNTKAKATKHQIAPRGMSERQAAALWGVSAGTHRKMVLLGLAPPPMNLPGIDRRIYDRKMQEGAIDALGANPSGLAVS
jgi:hypothetical protein